tara:strand:+ start:105 stop:767 length:663 start_codon:yes stop_codon:yes gene_type:complete
MKITKKELREVIQEVADELGLFEGLTKAQEKLPEPLKKAILKKQEEDGVEDGSDDETITEGNAWGAAIKKAREENLKEFEFNGKKYKLTEKKKKINEEDTSEFTGNEDEVEEGNAFGAAVTKAKKDGDDEFEVGGKTYKVKEDVCPSCGEDPCIDESSCSEDDEDEVEEGNAFGAAVTKAKEDGDTEFEVDGKTYKVRENWSKITLSEKLDRMLGNRKVL